MSKVAFGKFLKHNPESNTKRYWIVLLCRSFRYLPSVSFVDGLFDFLFSGLETEEDLKSLVSLLIIFKIECVILQLRKLFWSSCLGMGISLSPKNFWRSPSSSSLAVENIHTIISCTNLLSCSNSSDCSILCLLSVSFLSYSSRNTLTWLKKNILFIACSATGTNCTVSLRLWAGLSLH